jgi:acyl phosphate:glycerol-3-phosphate acyltransferase
LFSSIPMFRGGYAPTISIRNQRTPRSTGARCGDECGARSSTAARSFATRVDDYGSITRRPSPSRFAPTPPLPRSRGRVGEGAGKESGRGAAVTLLLAAVIGYLLGSIPFGLLVTRLAGHGDIRRFGSGNIGATNVLRTGNKALAALTLLLDLGKGAAAVLMAQHWGHTAALVAAGGVILGHMFPIWLGFRGGKGVATALGVLIPLAWPVALAAAIVWLVTALLFHYSSLAALVAAVLGAGLAALTADTATASVIAGIALLIILRHHANIRRLVAGTESRISFTKS